MKKTLLCAMVLLLAAGLAQAEPAAPAPPTGAKAILKSMSDWMGSQKSLDLTFDSDIEIITPQLEKIQFTNSGSMLLVRPDRFRGHRVGGYADVELVFDGKTASVLAKNINSYTQIEMPGTVDQMIAAMRAGHGVAMPFGDFLLSRPYDVLVADVLEAKHIGRGVIDGTECEHLAFRNGETDWQVWVEVGPKPMPRKIVITSKTMAAAPQYTVRIKSWKTDVTPAAGTFAFVPPAGAKKLPPDALIDLDELPQMEPMGGVK
ncbi:MAG TPA: DUF2092 domain-containing protein [Thermoanaerobaculia bacterium]|nr:DUF2092 domain-containing protein [Thermoanaerobaculia bacterium]